MGSTPCKSVLLKKLAFLTPKYTERDDQSDLYKVKAAKEQVMTVKAKATRPVKRIYAQL